MTWDKIICNGFEDQLNAGYCRRSTQLEGNQALSKDSLLNLQCRVNQRVREMHLVLVLLVCHQLLPALALPSLPGPVDLSHFYDENTTLYWTGVKPFAFLTVSSQWSLLLGTQVNPGMRGFVQDYSKLHLLAF